MASTNETPASTPPVDPSVMSAFQWLLALGFPPDAAAASLMPELFTREVRPPESRPGRLRLRPLA